jgi:hypothetical protein
VVYARDLCRIVTPALPILATFASEPLLNMRTSYVSVLLATLLTVFANTEINAKTPIEISLDSIQAVEIAKDLLIRLDEINAIDRARLTTSETKSLRKERRLIKGELKELRKGTYVSVKRLVALLLVPIIIFNISQ